MDDDVIDAMFGGLGKNYPGSKQVRKSLAHPVKEKKDIESWEENSQV